MASWIDYLYWFSNKYATFAPLKTLRLYHHNSCGGVKNLVLIFILSKYIINVILSPHIVNYLMSVLTS